MDEHDTSNEIRQDPEKKYPALTGIARFYKILAYVVGVSAILAFILGFIFTIDDAQDNTGPGAIILLVSLFGGSTGFITFLALSESITIFIDMAGNLSKIKEDMGEDLSEIKRRLADKSD